MALGSGRALAAPRTGASIGGMKTDLSHLPEHKREELADVTRVIRETVDPEMVILFGSHARGDWVEDERTGYVSDYDILIVTIPKSAEGGSNSLPKRVEKEVAAALRHRDVNAIAHDQLPIYADSVNAYGVLMRRLVGRLVSNRVRIQDHHVGTITCFELPPVRPAQLLRRQPAHLPYCFFQRDDI